MERGTPVSVVTYAAPRAGNRAFKDLYDISPITHDRYEFGDDLVPHLPSTIGGFVDKLSSISLIGHKFAGIAKFDYEHVGVLKYIDRDGVVHSDSPTLHGARHVGIIKQVVARNVPRLALDHRIACTGGEAGYLGAVAPTGVC